MSDVRTRLEATTGDALLVTRRRAAQDRGLLVGTAVLLLATLVLTLAVPRLVERTADLAVRETIQAAGRDADLVTHPVMDPLTLEPPDPRDGGYEAATWLESALGADTHEPVAQVVAAVGVLSTPVGEFGASLVHVGTPGQDEPVVRWVAGTPPVPVPAAEHMATRQDHDLVRRVEVGLSAAAAAELGITLADGPLTGERIGPGRTDHVVVTGLYEPVDPQAAIWQEHAGLLAAVTARPGMPVPVHVAAYVPYENVPDMLHLTGRRAVTISARAAVDTEGMSVADAHRLVDRVEQLSAQTGRLSTRLPEVVTAFDTRMSAARAQASLVLTGVAATAALCLVLAASLLVGRRRELVVAERARGASIASVAFRGLLESVPVVVVVAALAAGLVGWWLPGHASPVLLAVVVVLVAALAPAVLAAGVAASATSGRRTPADRRDRAAQRARLGARRLVVEGLVVALAVAAVVSLTGRGLLPLASGEVDPLLSAAPVLLAAAAALVVVRVSPAVVRAAGRGAVRSRGLAAPLAVARAHGATTAVVPLLAVTVAVALVVLCGTLVHSVRTGQQAAATQLVGAHVRIDGPLGTYGSEDLVDRLAASAGVTASATGAQISKRSFGENTFLKATLLVVDAAELAEVRRAVGLPDLPGLATLGEPGPDGTVPALVGAELLERAHLDGTGVVVGAVDAEVLLDVRGTTDLPPDPGAPRLDARAVSTGGGGDSADDDGVVVVDRRVLAAVADQRPSVDRLWLAGPGAVAAVEAADIAPPATSGLVVTTRDGWHRAWSQSPLPEAMVALLLSAVGVLAALSVLALVLVVVATARERGRTLSALRTLGLDARTARWATLGELAPLVLGGLLGGAGIGLGLPALLGGALGLQQLTAEPGAATVATTWWPVAAAVAALAVALVVAVLTEQAVRRRDRLGEVLRVGER
ncbi:FtsX-like permease family protein [Cellulomonas wangsupingiae]|uniref:ABC3 transporter permease C-terminal domain-containing protein n=1 Tax=Cellulomonas wangsupingiae TaxID=2968085 RepID=A0ABY5K819_9CELL|nr:FtsX-like permease family protein [Cellulomonas wangsupingiae]MCC2334408.1 hypothetical protein [Cellulomonas wangsupingiae]UUI66075.1 hypothetical protein NP075_04935 [Cellulomonas wangsupingiae]